ncbi:MAG: hypothetical protein M0R17_02930 [Candidatus Omnitrophica bacterium]|nr:hypothetical protein [Candidatus Omnitrophota bacterium]
MIKDTKDFKLFRSDDYNFNFNKHTGYFERWGKTEEDDPLYSLYGPEILDWELVVNGCINANKCKFCYKDSKVDDIKLVDFEMFKKIFHKFDNSILCQIAYGITGIKSHPDFIKILKYTREHGIIPNFTLSGFDADDEIIKESCKYIGAVAVSAYEYDKNMCYNTVQKFINNDIKQTNIHLTVMNENINFVYEVLKDIQNDKRLEKLNAVVLLKLKPRGKAKDHFTNLSQNDYNKLFEYCLSNNIPLGMDSCHARNLELYLQQSEMSREKVKTISESIESCESFGLFSSYINVDGFYFPCSFTEGEGEWETGLDVLNCNNFVKDVWLNEKLNKYRKLSLDSCYSTGCRKCITFDIDPD